MIKPMSNPYGNIKILKKKKKKSPHAQHNPFRHSKKIKNNKKEKKNTCEYKY